MYQNLDDGRQTYLGTASIMLSGQTGFTDAIAYHFYEKGFDQYLHTVENVYELVDLTDESNCTQLAGKVSVRLRLTCHGPEERQTNRVWSRLNERPQRHLSVDQNAFDYPCDDRTVHSQPKMTYSAAALPERFDVTNREIAVMYRCQR